MKSNVPTCPACGEPLTPSHLRLLVIPALVFNALTKAFERVWSHPNSNPTLN